MVGLKNRLLKDFNDLSWMNENINYDSVNDILEKEKNQSIKLLSESLDKLPNNINTLKLNKECTGCTCCKNICPVNAISFDKNAEGFMEPYIDDEKCILCGKCLKKCPQKKIINNNLKKQACYVAQIKDKDKLLVSASGGVFYALAKKFLDQNGIVYGAAYTKNIAIEHIRINNIHEVHKLQGSKYVQSHLNNIFKKVEEDLKNGLKVLFSGTPCQIAGLHEFLSKPYKNLFTIDLICHGVPSQAIFKKYLSYLERKYKGKIVSYDFRNKEKKGWDTNYKIEFESGKKIFGSGKLDIYYQAFLTGKIYRECCYQCKYANMNRVSDITIGDFWGIENVLPEFNTINGVSGILINSEKGKKIFDEIGNSLEFYEVDPNELKKYNGNLNTPTNRPDIRNIIYTDLKDKEFKNTVIFSAYNKSIKNIISYKIPTNLKLRIKKVMKK